MEATTIKIGGFTPFSLIDFPEHFAAIVFMQGCLWRCPYCYNHHLQSGELKKDDAPIFWQDIIDFLIKRKNKLDGVVFSGGEPLIQPAIISAIKDVKALGYDVAIHTGGSKPEFLAKIIKDIDWVGLDIKAPDYLYQKITGGIGDFSDVAKSLDILIASGVDFEARTTVYPLFLGEDEIFKIASYLAGKGVKKYFLQEYRPISNNIENKSNILKDKDFLNKISNLFAEFSVRS